MPSEVARALDLSAQPAEVADAVADYAYARAAAGATERLWQAHPSPLHGLFEERAAAHGRGILQASYREIVAALHLPASPGEDFRDWEADGVAREAFAKAAGPLGWLRRLFNLRKVADLVDKVLDHFAPLGSDTEKARQRILEAYLAGREADAVKSPEGAAAVAREVSGASLDALGRRWALSEPAVNEVLWMSAMGGEHVRGWGEGARTDLRKLLLESRWQKWTPEQTRRALFARFGELGRDWRRIAITETNEALNQGFIASLPMGTRVRRLEALDTSTCAHCRSIHGKVYTVVDPAQEPKDPGAQIWLGRNNIGRSNAPRKRTAHGLVERGEHERWWTAAGAQHASCRGRWEKV